MGVDDEYEGGPDQLAEKMAELDEVLAEQRAQALRAGLEDFDLDEDDAALLAGLAGERTGSSSCRRCRSWRSWVARTSASRRW